MSTAMLAAALDLAAEGWAVFPCKWRGESAKSPLNNHGHLEASRAPAEITAWWTRWPKAMIGARVPDSLLVVDIDPRNGGSLEELERLAGAVPETLTAWSGRGDGGRHLYFRRPAGQLVSTRLPKGVDLKVNGYCIMPPSVHPQGARQPYRWDLRTPALMTPALRSLLRPVVQPRRDRFDTPRGDGSALVRFVAKHTTDGVNNALYWAAKKAAAEGVLDTIARELIDTAVSVGESERRARATVESARKKILGGAR